MADILQPPLNNGFNGNDNKEDFNGEEMKEETEKKDKEGDEALAKPVKQIASGLDSVMVSGMLRNISDKVATKLKQESEEELVEIMVKRMEKEEEEGSGMVSWEEWPTGDHLMANPTAGRVKAGPKRPPTAISRRREGSERSEEEDFDSLLAAMEGESEGASLVEVEEDLDDAFDSLLKESTHDETEIDEAEENLRKKSVDDDFNLLLEDNDIKEEELVEKVEIVSTEESSGEEEEEENLRKRSVEDDFNLLLEDNDIKEEELVDKVEIVSTEESSAEEEEEENERMKVKEEEVGNNKVIGEAKKSSMMTQEQDARADNKEGDAAVEVTQPKCASNEGQAGVEESKNELKSGSKDPFDELFEELADGELEAEEGFQQIFGKGGVETTVVDTPTPQVFREEISGGEAEEVGQMYKEKMEGEQEMARVEEREREERDEIENEMEEKQEQIQMQRSIEEELAFSKLLADQEIARETFDSAQRREDEVVPKLDSKSVIEEVVCVGGPDVVDAHQQNVNLKIRGNEEKEKRVIEIEEVIDEARVRELAEELAREVVERERAKHKEEVISMAREVVGEREVFTDRIDRLENEVEVLQGEVSKGQSEVERLIGVVEEQAAQLASAREEVKVLSGLRDEGPGEAGKRVVALERELEDQREVNAQLKAYVGEVLVNIMLKNPQILERKA